MTPGAGGGFGCRATATYAEKGGTACRPGGKRIVELSRIAPDLAARAPVAAPGAASDAASPAPPGAQPRAMGDVALSVRRAGAAADAPTRLADLRQQGSLKVLFPRGGHAGCMAVLVNTAGGVTGGDSFATRALAEAGATLTLSTQAAERAYRAQPGQLGRIRTTLTAQTGARLAWLPQETLLYQGAALDRHLSVDLHGDATALVVEPLVLGRAAMGEVVTDALLRDTIELRRDGRLLCLDRVTLSGDIAARMVRPGVARGAGALANVIFAGPRAEALLDPLRAMLPDADTDTGKGTATGGATLRAPGLLCLRLLASDSFALRRSLVPILERLHGDALPRPWML